MSRARTLLSVFAFGSALSVTGCIKKMLTDGQIASTRRASSALNSIGDYEMARGAAQAGLAQFEGMHQLAPNNEDALFLLTRSWTSYGFAFVEDEYEQAVDADNDDLAEYHKKRARNAYDRAVFYGLELLSHKADGFEAAKKNEETLKKWLDENFDTKEDAENLFWTGYGWLARVNISKDDPAVVGELFVGVALLEQSVKLDPTYNNWSGTVALAAYHARTAMAEMDQAKQLFELALAKTGGKNLMVQTNYALKYACMKGDKALYEKLLNEVLAADDPDPNQRLTNTIAKRRAKRGLTKARMENCGF
jgi:tetratricopeptide (TPR) repeat protein